METETSSLKMRDVSFIICIIALIISSLTYWQITMTTKRVHETVEIIEELQEFFEFTQKKYVDVQYGCSTYDAETGFHTQLSLFNRGTIPATDVRITLTFPAGTEIQRIIPPMKFTESETDLGKLVILEIQRLGVEMPIPILVTSSHKSTAPLQIQCNEDTEVEG